MKRFYKIPFVVLGSAFLVNVVFAQAPNWVWAKGMGGVNSDYGKNIAVEAHGNSYITGEFSGASITFDSITLINSFSFYQDIFLVKYNTSGNVVWAKSVKGSSYDRVFGMTVDLQGNSCITGWAHSDSLFFDSTLLISNSGFFIAKYDSSGNIMWAKTADAYGYAQGNSVAVDINGNSYVTGAFGGSTLIFDNIVINNLDSVYSHFFIVKYDSIGNAIWAKTTGQYNGARGMSLTVDANGNSYVTGHFYSFTCTFDSITLFNHTSTTAQDLFIAKYNASGNLLWAKSAGGNYNDEGNGIALNVNGFIYLTGKFESDSISFDSITLFNTPSGILVHDDIFLVKYDLDGNVIWAKSAGGSERERANAVVVDTNGSSYICGSFISPTISFGNTILTNAGGSSPVDIYVAKYDNSGNSLWAKSAGGTGAESSNGIGIDANENVYMTGYFGNSTILFGSTTLANTSTNHDVFIAKLDAVTGIDETKLNSNSVSISPNPATTFCTITSTLPHATTLTLYDITGRALLQQPFNRTTTINISHLTNGIYIAEIKDKEGRRVVGKVVKK